MGLGRHGGIILDTRRLVEKLFGEYVLRDENESGGERAEDAGYVARKFHATSQNNAQGQRDKGQVSRGGIFYIEDDAVRKNCEKGRESLDRVYQRDGYLRCSRGREDMSAELEEGKGQRGSYHLTTRLPYPIPKGRDEGSQGRKRSRQIGKEETP